MAPPGESQGDVMSKELTQIAPTDVDNLLDAIGTDEEGILTRLAFLEFGEKDAEVLAPLREQLKVFRDEFGDRFYNYLSSYPSLQMFLRTPGAVERLKRSKLAYRSSVLVNGHYDRDYVRDRIASGITHQRVGLAPEWYIGGYRKYLTELLPILWQACEQDFSKFEAAFTALAKISFFDLGIAFDTYFVAYKRAAVQAQEITEHAMRIFANTSPETGKSFLRSLAAELSKVLKVRYAMVLQIVAPDWSRAVTLATTDGGEPQAEFGFLLQGSAAATAVLHGSCIYPSAVQEQFPADTMLVEMHAEGYAAIALRDSGGRPLGILAVLDEVPLVETNRINWLLSIFAVRAAAEIERLQVEQALSESETRFRAAFNQAATGIIHTGPDGRFLRVNDKLCDILGYQRSELIGRHFADITHPDDVQQRYKYASQLIAEPGSHTRFETRYLRKDGSPIWVQLTASSVLDDAGSLAYFAVVVEDISSHRKLEESLHLSNHAMDSLCNGVAIIDALPDSNSVRFANPAFCRMNGLVPDEMIGRDFLSLQADNDGQPELIALRAAIAGKKEVQMVLRKYCADGAVQWHQLSISPVTKGNVQEGATVSHLIVVQTDITEQKCYEEQLAFRTTHDELTGLPNRNLFKDHLQLAVVQARLAESAAALLLLDIDNFKLVNDRFDHAAGDLLLKGVAERLAGCITKGDTLARHDADEFAIILTGIDKWRNVSAICEQISHSIAEPFRIHDQSFHVTCSIGIALYPQDGEDVPTLFKYAGMALSRAKDLGRGNCQLFSREMNERTLERVTLQSALHVAISSDQLRLHYQPVVDLQTGQVISLEALVRWEHPELGFVSPARFIPVAEDSDLIADIGEWVVRKACKDIRSRMDNGFADLRVAVNVSPKQFRDPFLADKIESALRQAGIAPRLLCLEITENVLMQDTASSEATLQRLKELGVDLVLDDFGTGFSSLSYLKRFPFNRVKIDRSFVQEIVSNSDDAAISKAIISMAHSLGIRVVAEGVETEAQCEFLSRHMCDEIQGYLFSQALAQNDIEALLREDRRLPEHLLRLLTPRRTLLLVDDESNILASLKRLLRRDNYEILTANGGPEGLELLAQHEVDVIVSDQRMPGMTGVEFLRIAKDKYPDTVRIVLSGYTELQSVTDAVNEGAIYKFLTKPWDDAKLRGHVEEAFRRKEMADENQRLNLEVRTANHELALANQRLEELLKLKQQQIIADELSLDIVREALQHVPLPVIGLDDDDVVAFVNVAGQELFKNGGSILGCDANQLMPELLHATQSVSDGEKCIAQLEGMWFQVISRTMGKGSQSRGKLMTLTRCEVTP
jgi:diguanylate cyclase (GGDEF)-like protein/PAS domain S-box-containing protein